MNSDVFESMLTYNWKDSREGRVKINDVEFEVMDTFIRALHSVEIKIKDITKAIKLMILADYYKVEPLQVVAEKYVTKGSAEKVLLKRSLSDINLVSLTSKKSV